jgi:hypothetical protein
MNPKLKAFLFFWVCVAGGAGGGYFSSSFSPVQAQIAIVDINALVMKAVADNSTQTEEGAKALTARVKETTNKLVQQGIVVLDAQSVIDAPEEAYVSIE